jgi:hypothetical protein
VKQITTNFEFTTTAHEAELLQRYRARVEAWGWKVSIEFRCCSHVGSSVYIGPTHQLAGGMQGRK